ncbi:MAG: hypothetical protein IT384_02850 [Deltaproteobacteria bacterium]|nr:hypothetical protein [Deltaproteobacteria bacterium]
MTRSRAGTLAIAGVLAFSSCRRGGEVEVEALEEGVETATVAGTATSSRRAPPDELPGLTGDWPCRGGGLVPSPDAAETIFILGEEQLRWGAREALLLERRGSSVRLSACWYTAFDRTAFRLERLLEPTELDQLWTLLEQEDAFSLPALTVHEGRAFNRTLWLRRGERVHRVQSLDRRSGEDQQAAPGLASAGEKVTLLLGAVLDFRRRFASEIRLAPREADGTIGDPARLERKLLVSELARQELADLLDRGQLPDHAWEDVLRLAQFDNAEIISALVKWLDDERPWISGAAKSALHLRVQNEDPRKWWARVRASWAPSPAASLPPDNEHLTLLARGAGGLSTLELDPRGVLWGRGPSGRPRFRYRENAERFELAPDTPRPERPRTLAVSGGRFVAHVQRAQDGLKSLVVDDRTKKMRAPVAVPPARILRLLAATAAPNAGYLVFRDERDPISDSDGAIEIWWINADGQVATRRFAAQARSGELFRVFPLSVSDGSEIIVAIETADATGRRYLELGWLELSRADRGRPTLNRVFVEPKPTDGRRARGPFFEGEVDASADGQRVVLLYDGRVYEWLRSDLSAH